MVDCAALLEKTLWVGSKPANDRTDSLPAEKHIVLQLAHVLWQLLHTQWQYMYISSRVLEVKQIETETTRRP